MGGLGRGFNMRRSGLIRVKIPKLLKYMQKWSKCLKNYIIGMAERVTSLSFLTFKELIREAGAFCLIIVLNYWGLEMGCQLVKK